MFNSGDNTNLNVYLHKLLFTLNSCKYVAVSDDGSFIVAADKQNVIIWDCGRRSFTQPWAGVDLGEIQNISMAMNVRLQGRQYRVIITVVHAKDKSKSSVSLLNYKFNLLAHPAPVDGQITAAINLRKHLVSWGRLLHNHSSVKILNGLELFDRQILLQ